MSSDYDVRAKATKEALAKIAQLRKELDTDNRIQYANSLYAREVAYQVAETDKRINQCDKRATDDRLEALNKLLQDVKVRQELDAFNLAEYDYQNLRNEVFARHNKKQLAKRQSRLVEVSKNGSSTEFVGEKWTSWGFAPDPRILEALQDK